MLPDDPGSLRTPSERDAFDRLKRSLSQSYTVFPGVPWVEVLPELCDRRSLEGEADFVVAHPEKGVIVLEIKGKGVACKEGRWYRTDPLTQAKASIEAPNEQVSRTMRALMGKMKGRSGWPKGIVCFGWCVGFPFTPISDADMTPALKRVLLLDQKDFGSGLQVRIDAIFAFWASQERAMPLSSAGLKALEELLAPSREFADQLAAVLRYEDKRLAEAAREQLKHLEFLKFNSRAVVTGCAGTGKTVLARARALALAKEGRRVLLACFNKLLSEANERLLAPSLKGTEGQCDIASFHEVCVSWAREAGAAAAPMERLPAALADAAKVLGPRYDAIVVDEAQDFKREWWGPLLATLKDRESGGLQIFLDPNQAVYHLDYSELPVSSPRVPLTINCRNTQKIHEFVRKFFKSQEAYSPAGPLGREVEWVEYSSPSEMVDKLDRKICDLVAGGLSAQDVIVLTCRKKGQSGLFPLAPIDERMKKYMKAPEAVPAAGASSVRRLACGVDLIEGFIEGGPGGQVAVETVRRFKGLEKQVVVLAEAEAAAEQFYGLGSEADLLKALLYVGGSRARTHLIVLWPRGKARPG